MAKFVRTDSVGYVVEVSNTSVFNCDYEVGDTAATGKWVDKHNLSGTGANTIHDRRLYPEEMVKDVRNRLLMQSDFLVGADSPYIDNSTVQTRIKAYRQKLRDMFDADASKNWKSWAGYVSGDIFHSGIQWPTVALGTGDISGTQGDCTTWIANTDESGFLLPGGPYKGCDIHGHVTDTNFC